MSTPLIVTLGDLGSALIENATRIFGPSQHLSCCTVSWEDDFDVAETKIRAAIEAIDPSQDVIILTGLYGSMVANICLGFVEKQPQRIHMVTGVNLPMVLEATVLTSQLSAADTAKQLQEKARRAITSTNDKV